MAALTKDTPREYVGARTIVNYKVAASTTIYQGGALGKTVLGVVDTFDDGDVFAGFALDAIATDAAATDMDIAVVTEGIVKLTVAASGSSAIGTTVYATTDGDFSVTDSGSDTAIGELYQQVSSTTWYVSFKADGIA